MDYVKGDLANMVSGWKLQAGACSLPGVLQACFLGGGGCILLVVLFSSVCLLLIFFFSCVLPFCFCACYSVP